MNERITEQLTRELLRKKNYFKKEHFLVEEQMSSNLKISALLHGASKSGNGIGKPEFIITNTFVKNLIIVIECKASIKKHMSETLQMANDYAVDGALHYARFLSKGYNVIAIGISGQSEAEMKMDTYFWLKGDYGFTKLPVKGIASMEEYITLIENNKNIYKRRHKIITDEFRLEKEAHDWRVLFRFSVLFFPTMGIFIGKTLKPFTPLGNKIALWYGSAWSIMFFSYLVFTHLQAYFF